MDRTSPRERGGGGDDLLPLDHDLTVRLARMLAPSPAEVIREAGHPPEADRLGILTAASPSPADWSSLCRLLGRMPTSGEQRAFVEAWRELVMVRARIRPPWTPEAVGGAS